MNIVTARLDHPDRDDGPAIISFAGYQLHIPAEVTGAKPGIKEYLGREVILGIRPSDFEDASLADPGWPRMPVTANVTEQLGTELLVTFLIDAPPVEHKDTAALAADQGEDEAAIPLAGANPCGPHGPAPAAGSRRAARQNSAWTPVTCTSLIPAAAWRSGTAVTPTCRPDQRGMTTHAIEGRMPGIARLAPQRYPAWTAGSRSPPLTRSDARRHCPFRRRRAAVPRGPGNSRSNSQLTASLLLIFADHATGASLSSHAVIVEMNRFG